MDSNTENMSPQKAGKARLAARAYEKGGGNNEPDWTLLQQYTPLVKSIVSRMRIYFPSHIDIEDIYSVAVSGLISAIRKRNPEKTESFASYATLRIRGAILDELRKMDWLPRATRTQAKKVKKVIADLEQKLKRPATEEEICTELKVSKKQYAQMMDQIRPISIVSMDSQVGDDGNSGMVHEVVPDSNEMDARENCEKREMVTLLRNRIKELPDVPKKILTMYYFEGMRLAEIAEIFGLTESRICQIHSQAVISLRSYLDNITKR